MTATTFLAVVSIFAVLYLAVQAVLGFGASRFDSPSDDERS